MLGLSLSVAGLWAAGNVVRNPCRNSLILRRFREPAEVQSAQHSAPARKHGSENCPPAAETDSKDSIAQQRRSLASKSASRPLAESFSARSKGNLDLSRSTST